MVRIRMLTSVSGEGFVWERGQEIDLPGSEAAAWADGRRAELVREEPLQTPETTRTREKTARPRRTTARKE
ncbi:hypothetical protein [Streptomyces sp. NPDC002994]|uniref:hypothetical protein n=1 Tax=Streptomyces sp. NPDC002994 TaxID=3154441 RepID=UPI0033A97892